MALVGIKSKIRLWCWPVATRIRIDEGMVAV